MTAELQVTILNVGYRSTNFWVISAGRSRILVDLGWPCSMGTMRANLQRMGVPIEEIRYGLATHYHIDHAGLGEELKRAGVSLLVMETQVEAIPVMKRWTKPQDHYMDIAPEGNVVVPFRESRALLEQMGLGGEILSTPGHSDDSVSLLLDDGSVFTGDLTPLPYVEEGEAGDLAAASWDLLREHGAKRIYPGHGEVREMYEAGERATG